MATLTPEPAEFFMNLDSYLIRSADGTELGFDAGQERFDGAP